MKLKILIVLTAVIVLCGCSGNTRIKGGSAIDWVDFLKLNGHSYTGSWENVIKNPAQVTTETIGEVDFKVADVVTNPHYQTKDGDAAFLEKGTKLYRIEGFKTDEVIAAKDETRIGGYRLYVEDDYSNNLQQRYNDVIKHNIERVELYHQDDVKPYKTLTEDETKRFIHLLESGKNTQNHSPQNKNGDPEYYQVVLYTGRPFAFSFSLVDDGVNVFFSPWDTRIVGDEIRSLLQP
ncbi:hypothetical protein MKX70_27900 [Paenibacillus sp. FSL R7-0312]|uniref:hypothetical protein n=1 Tax=unclassified Paenibacillus TaxID=185978 RepID=UPI0004F70B63|nr:hypothetical protein [Paenibacillus sp. FSL R5-0912]AIQ40653.1 hypothetical protein R50912_11945 [Paenibacillus sp. FSL R5-0912]